MGILCNGMYLKEDKVTRGRVSCGHKRLHPPTASTKTRFSTNIKFLTCAYELDFRCNHKDQVQTRNPSQTTGLRRLLILQTAPTALGCQRDDLAVCNIQTPIGVWCVSVSMHAMRTMQCCTMEVCMLWTAQAEVDQQEVSKMLT